MNFRSSSGTSYPGSRPRQLVKRKGNEMIILNQELLSIVQLINSKLKRCERKRWTSEEASSNAADK
jgi:hypothetical protein